MSLAWRCRFEGRPLRKCYRAKTEAAILHREGCSFFAQVLRHLVWQLGRGNAGSTLNLAACFAARWLLLQVARMKVLAVPPKRRSNSSLVWGLELRRSFANSPWTQQHARPFKVIIRPVLLDRITQSVAQRPPFWILFNKFCGKGGSGGREGAKGGEGGLDIKKRLWLQLCRINLASGVLLRLWIYKCSPVSHLRSPHK